MTDILDRQHLALKDMPEMPIAVGTKYLGAPTIGIHFSPHCAGYLVVEAGPPTMRGKLVFGTVQRCFTAAAKVKARPKKIIVLTAERAFSAFLDNDPVFFRGQWLPIITHTTGFLCANR
ncbi:hypothetical protein GCM10027297_34420 [Parahaliea aestuarii]